MISSKGLKRRDTVAVDRILVDLHDQRDHLSIQISLYEEGDVIDPAVISTMQNSLWVLDKRISKHRTPIGA
jgi:hypothetical protein